MSSKASLGEKFESDLLELLPKLGFAVVEKYKTRLKQRDLGDFRIRDKNGHEYDIDAKAEVSRSGNFPIEVCQDWVSGDPGWFAKHIDEVWYGRYHAEKLSDVYRVDLNSIRRLSSRQVAGWRATPTTINASQTRTLLVLAPLDDLVRLGCAVPMCI